MMAFCTVFAFFISIALSFDTTISLALIALLQLAAVVLASIHYQALSDCSVVYVYMVPVFSRLAATT